MAELVWRRSSRCEHATCVEVAAADMVWVRDSQLGDRSPILAFDRRAWADFCDAIRAGEFG